MSCTSELQPEDLILSDVHLYNPFNTTGRENFALSRFYFSNPQSKTNHSGHESGTKIKSNKRLQEPGLRKDEDGDFIVERDPELGMDMDVITIEHSLATPLSSVGSQVWRGSLLLCDFLIHHEREFDGCVALELGGGVGLCSIVMARMARKVFCTDIGGVLDICEANMMRNRDLFKYHSKGSETSCPWTNRERDELKMISLIIASDVIYDNRLTDAFLDTTLKLFNLSPDAVLYLAMEKRLNFTLEDLNVVSPAHDYFLAKLGEVSTSNVRVGVEEIPTTFPQYFEYDRVKELELWKITKSKENKQQSCGKYGLNYFVLENHIFNLVDVSFTSG